MRKGLSVAVLCLFVFVFVGAVYAQEGTGASEWTKQAFQNRLATAKEMKFEGDVVSHDPLCHCVVVKTAKGMITMQDDYARFMQEYDQAKGLKVGSKVHGTYKVVSYINYMTTVAYAQ